MTRFPLLVAPVIFLGAAYAMSGPVFPAGIAPGTTLRPSIDHLPPVGDVVFYLGKLPERAHLPPVPRPCRDVAAPIVALLAPQTAIAVIVRGERAPTGLTPARGDYGGSTPGGGGGFFVGGSDGESGNDDERGAPGRDGEPGLVCCVIDVPPGANPVPPVDVSPIPVPAAGWLLAVAFGGLIAWRKR